MVLQVQNNTNTIALTAYIPVSTPSQSYDYQSSAYSGSGILNSQERRLNQEEKLVTDILFPKTKWFNTILQKINKLSSLPLNWDEYGAKKIGREVIIGAIQLLSTISQESTPEPYVFPTATGGIQIEWHTEEVDLEVEVTEDGSILVVYEGPDQHDEDGDDWEQKIYSQDLSRLIDCIKHLN
ncbi:MAG: hypothetical protein NTY09_14635 [bacterium]|nr:hypothetical protein [bacterium]